MNSNGLDEYIVDKYTQAQQARKLHIQLPHL
jgi:hypothetical protein